MPSESWFFHAEMLAADLPSFEETVANAAILRLHTAALWAEVRWTPFAVL